MIKGTAWKGKKRQYNGVDDLLQAADQFEEKLQAAKMEGAQAAVIYAEAIIYQALLDTHRNWSPKAIAKLRKRADEIAEDVIGNRETLGRLLDGLKERGITFDSVD